MSNEKQVSFGSLKLGDYFADKATKNTPFILWKKISPVMAKSVAQIGYTGKPIIKNTLVFGKDQTVYIDENRFKDILKGNDRLSIDLTEQYLSGLINADTALLEYETTDKEWRQAIEGNKKSIEKAKEIIATLKAGKEVPGLPHLLKNREEAIKRQEANIRNMEQANKNILASLKDWDIK